MSAPTGYGQWRQSKSEPSRDWIRNRGPGTTNRRKFTNYCNAPPSNNVVNYQNAPTFNNGRQAPRPLNKFPSANNYQASMKKTSDYHNIVDGVVEGFKTWSLVDGAFESNNGRSSTESSSSSDRMERKSEHRQKKYFPVLMNEEDMNNFMRSGHIKIKGGMLIYKKNHRIDGETTHKTT